MKNQQRKTETTKVKPSFVLFVTACLTLCVALVWVHKKQLSPKLLTPKSAVMVITPTPLVGQAPITSVPGQTLEVAQGIQDTGVIISNQTGAFGYVSSGTSTGAPAFVPEEAVRQIQENGRLAASNK